MRGPHWLRDPQAPRLRSARIALRGEDKRNKNKGARRQKGPRSECRDGRPPPSDLPAAARGCLDPRTGEGKAAEGSTPARGFLPQQRDCHSSRGLASLRFQVRLQLASASLRGCLFRLRDDKPPMLRRI